MEEGELSLPGRVGTSHPEPEHGTGKMVSSELEVRKKTSRTKGKFSR